MARIITIKPSKNNQEINVNGNLVELDSFFAELNVSELDPKEFATVLALGNNYILDKALLYKSDSYSDMADFISDFIRLALNPVAESEIIADKAHLIQDAGFLTVFHKLNPLLFNKVFSPESFQHLINSISNYDPYHFTKLTPEQKSAFFDAAILMNCDRGYIASLLYKDNKVAEMLVTSSFAALDLIYELIHDEKYKSEHADLSLREQKYYLVLDFPSTIYDFQKLLVYEITQKKGFLKKGYFRSQVGFEALEAIDKIASISDSGVRGVFAIFFSGNKVCNYSQVLQDLILELRS